MLIPQRQLGSSALTSGAIGLGCMSVAPVYGHHEGHDPAEVINLSSRGILVSGSSLRFTTSCR